MPKHARRRTRRDGEREEVLRKIKAFLIDEARASHADQSTHLSFAFAGLANIAERSRGMRIAAGPKSKEFNLFMDKVVSAISEFARTNDEADGLFAELFAWQVQCVVRQYGVNLTFTAAFTV